MQSYSLIFITIARLFAFALISISSVAVGHAREFDEAFKEAMDYVYDHNDPASVQRKVNLYGAVVAEFPDHPRVNEVKLQLFSILECARDDDSMAAAAELIREVLDSSDIETAEGEEIAFEYLEFHLQNVPSHLRDLQAVRNAEDVARRIAERALKDNRLLAYVRATRFIGLALDKQGKRIAAVKVLFDAIGLCDRWLENGALEDLRRKSHFDYIRFSSAHENITQLIAHLPKYSDAAGFERVDAGAVKAIQDELDSRPRSKFESMNNVYDAMRRFKEREPEDTGSLRSVALAMPVFFRPDLTAVDGRCTLRVGGERQGGE